MFTNEPSFKKVSRQGAKNAKVFLGELCVFAREIILFMPGQPETRVC